MTSSTTNGYRALLETSIDEIVPSGQKMLVIDVKDSIQNAIKTLVSANFYSAPLFDSETQQYLGFVDLVDLVNFIVTTVESTCTTPEHAQERLFHVDKLEFAHKTQEGNLRDLSSKNPFTTVLKGSSLLKALEVFVSTGARRIAVLDGTKITNVLTQSAIVAWMSKHLKEIPFAKKQVKDLNFGLKKVISIGTDARALEAFKLMSANRITAVAVVDETGQLMSTLSAKDIKMLDIANPFRKLFQSALKFVQDIRAQSVMESMPIVHCYPKSTVTEVVMRLTSLKIHRIFIVDELHRPIGIISLGDVLKLLLRSKDEESSSEEESN
eukprot:TRINITY_DN6248_c0_g1_i3.p1 TRINITY_DN6248_c0_g1~~TRINITY_DN6248_c0_g1_i3.p1  ORF type:complete len:325 (+),score=61.63 TRINITY_DN6248_c0_g1_i3:111-1085(+)